MKRFILIALFAGLAELLAGPTPREVNQVLGFELLSDSPLWQERAEVVAQRMGMRTQSTGEAHGIWILTGTRLGTVPIEELRLFAQPDGMVKHLEATVLNKGDFFAEANVRQVALELFGDQGRAEEAQRKRSTRLERELKRRFEERFVHSRNGLGQALTRALGRSVPEHLKQGRRRRVDRWDLDDVSLLLDAEDGEFVILRILPGHQADAGGRGERVSDAALKGALAARVVRTEGGDCWLRDMPMVAQGDKGYCAVASGERLLRYMGIPVDSHQLADLANTDKYGGTPQTGIDRALRTLASKNRRTFRRFGGEPTINMLSRYIDKGIPLLWSVKVVPGFEETLRVRNERRTGIPTPAWRQSLRQAEATTRDLAKQGGFAHMRLIVGYNPETREIAFSDSWDGQPHMLWLTEKEARSITQRDGLAVLLP